MEYHHNINIQKSVKNLDIENLDYLKCGYI